MLVIQLSAFLAITAVLLIVAWIGYTLATTPMPEPLEGLIGASEPSVEDDNPSEG